MSIAVNVNEETFEDVTVAKIYDLVLKGWGNYRIRDYLRETKVPVPSWYQHIRGVEDKSHMFPDEDSKYIWRPDTLRLLIRNRVYCGDCVLCKSDTIFKTKQHFKTDEKEWITVENTHEATAFAANDDPLTVVNNLSDFIFGLIRAIGLIMLGFGIVQVGLSLKSHDPSQRANGFLTVAGGIVITFAKEILNLITG